MAVQSVIEVNQGLYLKMGASYLFLKILLLILGHHGLFARSELIFVFQVKSEDFRMTIDEILKLVLIIEIKDSFRKCELAIGLGGLLSDNCLQIFEVLKVLPFDLRGIGYEHMRMYIQIFEPNDTLSI